MMIDCKIIDRVEEISSYYQDKTVLVTGATGMLGQNIVALLLSMNEKLGTNIRVLAHVRNENKAASVFSAYSKNEALTYLISDIRSLNTDVPLDFIIHTASVTGGSKQHIDSPMTTISTALEGAKRVLDLALKNRATAIFLSSLEVYGFTGMGKETICETDGGYIDCTNVRSSYSESKRMCECMFASYAKQYGLRAFIARLTATFGYGVSKTDKRVFAQFAQSIIKNEDIILKSRGESVRNYCDAEDAAAALLYIMAKGKTGEAYNVANMETEISIKDMAQKFIELFPESGGELVFDLSEDATKLGYNAEMRNVVNSQKLMDLGWKPVFGMNDMILRLVNSLKCS